MTNDVLLPIVQQRYQETLTSDPDLRRSAPRAQVIQALQSDRLAAIEVLERACEAYADRPALGERAYTQAATGQAPAFLPEFRTITYQTVWRRTADLATGLTRDPRTTLRAGEVVGIYGFGSIEYVLADLACLYAGAASAVLQMGMPAEDLAHLVNEAGFAIIVCALENLPAVLMVLPDCPSLRSVVVMDCRGEGARDAALLASARAQTPLPLPTLEEIARLGQAGAPLAPSVPAPGTDPLATLMYTSGSTGFPKGAMLPQSVWRSHWRLSSLTQLLQFPSIGINFYPLSHAMGRNAVMRTLALGGAMHFTLKSDLSTLFEDIRLVRPTFLNLVPRISEMIYQAYRSELTRQLRTGQPLAEAQAQVYQAMRGTFLGDRLLAIVIGSAPTAPELTAFLRSCFEVPVFEIYGSTEAGVLSIDGEINRPSVSAYRLVEQPELGYRLSDQPYPRGELRVRTSLCIPGYFNNPAATQALYDAEGMLRTGDIVEERAPDQIAWVDRINNVVKLAQGEFVTIWRLESAFTGGSPLMDQVYLYANSQYAYLLAVIVPDEAAVNGRLRMEGKAATPGALRQLLRGELNRVAGAAKLRSYEVPRDILVETERWTRDNGLLTGINKPARPQLKLKYGPRLEALYAQLEAQQREDLEALNQSGASAPLAVKVRKAVEAVLGVPDLDLATSSFKDLGGDSISALSLAALLEEVCGVPVPVAAILNPGSPLQALVPMLEARLNPGAGALPSFASLHGQGPRVIRGADLRLERFLDAAELAEGAAMAAQPLAPVQTVLVTGANGFLGHVLCLEWLERLSGLGGKVYALVRAPDDPAAASRLAEAYHTGDARLEQRFASLTQHLEVMAGDLAAPRLGLPAATYERLAAEVDLIVHAGALVNHVFSYEQLFAPNVLGTAQLFRLALHTRRKRLDFVSSLGVLAGAQGSSPVPEAAGIHALQSVWPVQGGYAHGYATSKWAGEVLLQELHERFHTPVRVFRSDMILPHRRYLGQVNVADLLTRLLLSVVTTGLAPRSFYAPGPGPEPPYDGLPVDFTSAAMVALSSAGQEGCATYHVSNGERADGASLDTLMAWVESAGYPLERIGEYPAWFAAFKASLEELPAAERQHSTLPILHLWAQPMARGTSFGASTTQFREQVQVTRPAGESAIPQLTEAFLHKYLSDLRALGLLNPPDARPYSASVRKNTVSPLVS
jgi:fatty acid CoA ligase FadD9